MPNDAWGIGASLLRREDERHLHGRGEFVSDVKLPGTMEVAFVRSPHAHARIRSISVPPEAKGRVFAAADLPRVRPIRIVTQAAGAKSPSWPPLATDKVRYVGEAIAACIAPSRGEAEDLANAVSVDFEVLDAVVDAPRDMRGSRHLIHESWGDNLYLERVFEGGDIEAAARAAEVTVSREYRMRRQSGAPLEGRAVLAYRDHRLDEVVVYASTQTPHTVRVALGEILGLDLRRIRVVAPDVGGGFGPKARLYPEEIILAALALELDHPVRWVEDRGEHLTTAAHTRDHHYKVTAYADRQGRILGVDAEIVVDAGAYGLWPQGPYQEAAMAACNLPGPYTIPNYRARAATVATNKAPLGPYRGVGRPGACFAIERTIDEVARAVGREPNEVRALNMVRPDQMPFTTVGGMRFDNGDYPASVRLCAELLDMPAVRARQRRGEPDGKLIGIGFAAFAEQTAHGAAEFVSRGASIIPGFESCTARILADGSLVLMVGIQSHGQGLETALSQVAAHELGIDPERIAVRHGDTATTAFGFGTFASRSMVMSGGAVARASRMLRDKLCRIGAHLLQCDAGRGALRGRRGEGAAGLGADRRDRQGRASSNGRAAARRGPAARRDRDLRAGDRHRRLLLCDARRGRRRRPGDRLGRIARFRGRRGLRHDGQPDDRRRPDPGRRRAGDRHRPLRGDPLRRGRPAARRHPRRLSDAGRRRIAGDQDRPPAHPGHGDRIRHERHGRRRRRRPARRDRQRGARRPRLNRRRSQRNPDHPAPGAGGDRTDARRVSKAVRRAGTGYPRSLLAGEGRFTQPTAAA